MGDEGGISLGFWGPAGAPEGWTGIENPNTPKTQEEAKAYYSLYDAQQNQWQAPSDWQKYYNRPPPAPLDVQGFIGVGPEGWTPWQIALAGIGGFIILGGMIYILKR